MHPPRRKDDRSSRWAVCKSHLKRFVLGAVRAHRRRRKTDRSTNKQTRLRRQRTDGQVARLTRTRHRQRDGSAASPRTPGPLQPVCARNGQKNRRRRYNREVNKKKTTITMPTTYELMGEKNVGKKKKNRNVRPGTIITMRNTKAWLSVRYITLGTLTIQVTVRRRQRNDGGGGYFENASVAAMVLDRSEIEVMLLLLLSAL